MKVTLKAFNARLDRLKEEAETAIEGHRRRILAEQAFKQSLKSGHTIKLLAASVGDELDGLAELLLADLEKPMTRKDRAAAWTASITAIKQLGLGASTAIRFDLVSDQPSAIAAGQSRIAKAQNKAVAKMTDHRAGFDVSTVKRDTHSGAWFAGLERWAEKNKALVAMFYYLAGVASGVGLILVRQALEK